VQEDKSEAVVSQVKTILQMKWPYALREEVLAVGQIVAAHCPCSRAAVPTNGSWGT